MDSSCIGDPFGVFLSTAAAEAAEINARSAALRIVAASGEADPPSSYVGVLTGVEHFELSADHTVHKTDRDVPFTICFPADYLRSSDPTLQFRVVRVHAPLLHPNHRAGVVCLGEGFHPGTRLWTLVEQLYLVVSGRVAATHHGMDRDACAYFLKHPDEVRALRARPLWRQPVARRVRVEETARQQG